MKVDGSAETDTKWIAINHEASSLLDVIVHDKFTPTNTTKSKWQSLIKGSSLQENCNKEGFNIHGGRNDRKMYVRIGIVANDNWYCDSCNSCIGFGTSVTGCDGKVRFMSCGNIHACYSTYKNTATFGYILIQ
ncbi:Hypothetical predicted protein [Paramuricea clavata]|uniref:Uncharacterized protein n=1 Tax=Paramuricea clavata TaxID=317549 RepID=A0A7D9ESW5_PARCT|nr:Hypothetical predicted protein [Paramuricea clavata]